MGQGGVRLGSTTFCGDWLGLAKRFLGLGAFMMSKDEMGRRR